MLPAALFRISSRTIGNTLFYRHCAVFVSVFTIGCWGHTPARFLDFICLIRGFGYAVERNRKPYFTLILSCSLILAATALTYDGYLSLLTCAALLTSSVGMFTGRPTGMRILQFTVVSPGWLIYNICTFSIGGILCEAFNMLSILVYFIRTKLLKKEISA